MLLSRLFNGKLIWDPERRVVICKPVCNVAFCERKRATVVDRQTRTLRADYSPPRSSHISIHTNRITTTYCTTLPSTCYSPLVLPLVSHLSQESSFIPPGQPYHSTDYEEGRDPASFKRGLFYIFRLRLRKATPPRLSFDRFQA